MPDKQDLEKFIYVFTGLSLDEYIKDVMGNWEEHCKQKDETKETA